MAGFGAFLGHVAAGAMQGAGLGLQEDVKRQWEQAKEKAAQAHQLRLADREMAFRTGEREAGERFTAEQNRLSREAEAAGRQGDLIPLPDGTLGRRIGDRVEPLKGPNDIAIPAPKKAGYRQLTPEEIKARGLDPKRSYQVNENSADDDFGKVSPIGGEGTTVNVGAEGDKFYETLDKKSAEAFSALSEAGVQGRAKMAQIGRLEALLQGAPQGAAAMLKQVAGEYGINTEGLSDMQAAQALINELVPQQRQPGSGPMSDADLALFKQSLPRLINQPGGNQIIIDTMRGITQYQIQMGEIADAVTNREITPAEGRKRLASLANPLEGFSKSGGVSAPKAAIDMLRADPALAPQFDQKYGKGAAEKVLGAK